MSMFVTIRKAEKGSSAPKHVIRLQQIPSPIATKEFSLGQLKVQTALPNEQ